MAILFGSNAGAVSVIRDRAAEGAISLGNAVGGNGVTLQQGGLAPFNSIITRIGVSAAGNYQFLHTIGNDVYTYIFGDRMGDITLHGLSFSPGCPKPPGAGFIGPRNLLPHGFESLFDWYSSNRIAAQETPATVTIGSGVGGGAGATTFKGFIIGCTGDVADSKTRTIQFQITISLLPDKLS
jgi:hypothetical protein